MKRFTPSGPQGGACLLLCLVLASPASASEPPITAVVFAPDGESVVAVSQLGIHVFDWPELNRQRTIRTAAANLQCLAFSPAGKQLAVGGGHPAENGSVEIISWPSGESIAVLKGHDDSVSAVAWRGAFELLTASLDRDIKLWDVREKTLQQTFKGHSRGVTALCLLNDGNTLVSAGDDQSVRVWKVAGTRHRAVANDAALDVKRADGTPGVPATLIFTLNQHTAPVYAATLRSNEDGLPMIASAASDRTIRFWQPTIGRMVRYVRLEAEPLNIAWLNDGSRIVASCVDGRVRVIDADEVKVLQTLPTIEGWAYAIAVHPSDGSVAVGGQHGQLRRIDLADASP